MARPAAAALGGVIEDDVEEHLDAGAMELAHHGLELGDLRGLAAVDGVRGLGGEEADRAVAPEVVQALAGERIDVAVLEFVELVDRQQLDRGHAELAADTGSSPRRPRYVPGCATMAERMAGEAAHVQLVDHLVGERDARRPRAVPVEPLSCSERAPARQGAAGGAVARLDHPPPAAAGEGGGVRIDQHVAAVEVMQRVARHRLAVGAPAVARVGVDALQLDVPDVPGAVARRDRAAARAAAPSRAARTAPASSPWRGWRRRRS